MRHYSFCFLSTLLGKQSLSVTGFPSTNALRDHITAYMRAWKKTPRRLHGPNPPR